MYISDCRNIYFFVLAIDTVLKIISVQMSMTRQIIEIANNTYRYGGIFPRQSKA